MIKHTVESGVEVDLGSSEANIRENLAEILSKVKVRHIEMSCFEEVDCPPSLDSDEQQRFCVGNCTSQRGNSGHQL